jgi:hypothetical protein
VCGVWWITQVVVDRLGESEHFSVQQIKQCMRKVTAVDLMQTIKVRWRRFSSGTAPPTPLDHWTCVS